jgi:hypothetical protein
MTVTDTSALRAQIAALKGATTQEIATALGEDDLDSITNELLAICAERTERTQLPQVPFSIRHTMYGETSLSDWIVDYDVDGPAAITEAAEDAAVDAHVRWERWEDCVRVINADLQAMSLFIARRVVALGGADVAQLGHRWFMAVNFEGSDAPDRSGWLNARLTVKVNDDDELAAFVEEVGLDRLMLARATVLSGTMADLGVASDLAGTYLRWEVAGYPRMAQVDFDDTGRVNARIITAEEAAQIDPTTGVTTLFSEAKPFLYAAGGKENIGQQLVAGTLRLVGEPHRLAAFSAATQKIVPPPDPE